MRCKFADLLFTYFLKQTTRAGLSLFLHWILYVVLDCVSHFK